MFSLCIPTYDRWEKFLKNNLELYLKNELIDEIIITDDYSTDYENIKSFFSNEIVSGKIKVFQNAKRLGPFFNKIEALSKANNKWCALIDSDNFANIEYFQTIKNYIETTDFKTENLALSPVILKPGNSIYQEKNNNGFYLNSLNGLIFNRANLKNLNIKYRLKKSHINPNDIKLLMNVGNYVINKNIINKINLTREYLITYSSDVILMNTIFFEQLPDFEIHCIPNLSYEHTVHSESIYIKFSSKEKKYNELVYRRFENLL